MAAGGLHAGLGARHAAAMSISDEVDAVAIAVSESSLVRVFARGELRAEIAPELFLGGGWRRSPSTTLRSTSFPRSA
jgi:hypothetical protein